MSAADEHAAVRALAAALRRGPRRVVLRLGPRRRRRARCGWSSSDAPDRAGRRAGCTSTRCCRASAGPTWPPWTGAARATSRTSSPSRSCRATRWSGVVGEDVVGAEGARAGRPGSRVVLQPVLGCAARGIEPPCPACQAGQVGNCGRLAFGHIRPGLQTGFCADTGGGWSTTGLVAHRASSTRVPDALERRGRGDRRAGGLRGARGARRADRRGRRGRGARRGDARAAGHGRRLASRHHRALPVAVRAAGRGALRAPAAAGPRARLHRGAAARPAAARRAPPHALAVLRRRVRA